MKKKKHEKMFERSVGVLMTRVTLKIRLTGGDGDEVLVQGDGLVQPLPRLIQGVDAVSDTQTISAVFLHSSR